MSQKPLQDFVHMTGPAKEGFKGYIVPWPGPRGTRAQGARKSSGFRVKFWYRTITPYSNLPTAKISVSLLSTGNWSLFLLHSLYLGHPIVANLIKKREKCIKSKIHLPRN